MSILRHVKVEGLWDKRTLDVDFDPRVNFLIGVNGSGKTTLLNLIASALDGDFEGLARSPFGVLSCTLFSSKNDSTTEIVVSRSVDDPSPAQHFNYILRTTGKAEQRFTLVSPSPRYYLSGSLRRRASHGDVYTGTDEVTPLGKLVRVKWLSVHRAPSKSRSDERPGEPSVDRRLTSLSNELVRYFSKLAALRESETNRFLRLMLSAMVYNASDFDPFSAGRELKLAALQSSIEELLDTFLSEAEAGKARTRLRAQFDLAAKAQDEKDSFELGELVALAAVFPMQQIVGEWNRTESKQEMIAKPRVEFLQTLNSMYSGKTLSLTQKNELQVDLTDGKHLTLSELSSGEKQLLIIFAEALLQEKTEFIYIADEPELSLHVTWQEQLTRNLLRVNPNAQVIFATHSPDIVSEYGNHTIDMEALLS
jgi:predicted ATPase